MMPPLDFETQLKAAPVRNQSVIVTPSEHRPEVLIAKVTLRYRGLLKLAHKLFKLRDYRRFELAGISRILFEKLDGNVTVEGLVEWLQDTEKLTFFEARAFVVQYLRDLMQRGLVVILPDASLLTEAECMNKKGDR